MVKWKEKKNDTDSSSSSNMMCGSITIRLVVATMVKEQNPQSYQMELFPTHSKLSEKETCANRRNSNLYIQQFEFNLNYIMD